MLLRTLLSIIPLLGLLLFASEIYDYFRDPMAYSLGSESMIGEGGVRYSSEAMFITLGLTQCAGFVIVIVAIWLSKSKVVLFFSFFASVVLWIWPLL